MRTLAPVTAVGLVLVLVFLPLLLHFGQKGHNRIEIAALPGGENYAPGAHFGYAAARIMEHELDGTTGWRPNDLMLWGPRLAADNNANRQLGILQALRETLRIFKDELTKVSNDAYDKNLVAADNLLRNDPDKWAFPSAESRYGEAVQRLDDYVAGLQGPAPSSRPIITRNTELIALLDEWNKLLGGAHADMYATDTDWFAVDDVFYRATGYCHVIANMLPTIELEYQPELASREGMQALFKELHPPLARCAVIKPIYTFNGRDSGMLANQRRNLDSYINEARQKIYTLRDALRT